MPQIIEVSDVLHKIEAKLYPNYLGKGEGAYVARAKAEAPLSDRDVCAAAIVRGGHAVPIEDFHSHVKAFINELIHQLLDGFSVQLGDFISIHCKIGGTFHGANDHISAGHLHIVFRTLAHLKKLLLQVKIENEGLAGDGAYIDEIVDTHSESLNSTLTPGSTAHIVGHKIKVEGENPDCGVYFVNQEEGTRFKVTEHLTINRGTELVCIIPALPIGTFKLEIVTCFTNGTRPLKEPRTIKSENVLTVS
jgi:hypothetical protein